MNNVNESQVFDNDIALSKFDTAAADVSQYMSDDDFFTFLSENMEKSNIDQSRKIVEAEVIEVNEEKGYVVVDAGLKSEGIIHFKEFFRNQDKQEIAVGNKIKVYVSDLDYRKNGTLLSKERAIREESWQKICEAFANKTPVSGLIFAKTRSGYVVDIDAVIAFLPGSQADADVMFQDNSIVGRRCDVMVIHLDPVLRNVVVSVKAVKDLARKDYRDAFLDTVKEGDILEGVVKNITPYGAFINLGDIDGLLHVTDISWEKVGHPAEVLKIGQKVKVKVLKFSRVDEKIALGMKQFQDNPWANFQEKYKVGTIVRGKIINITSYGLFVGIENGIDGLVHVSELSWKNDGIKLLKENYSIGQEIEAMVIEINIEKHRIALGIKQLQDNPWKEFFSKFNIGDVIEGRITNIADFGIFISLNDQIDGLVGIDDVVYGVDNFIPSKYKIGDVVKVVYTDGNQELNRVKLSMRALHDGTINSSQKLVAGEKIDCTVLETRSSGIFVESLGGAIVSFIPKSNLLDEYRSLVPGDQLKCSVVSYDSVAKKLSLTATENLNTSKQSSAKLGEMIG